MLGAGTRAAVRRVVSRTLFSGAFRRLVATKTPTDFGTEDSWAVSGVEFKGRLASARESESETQLDVARDRDIYILVVPSTVALAIGDRVRRTNNPKDFEVVGIEQGENFGTRLNSAYRVAVAP